MALKVRQVLLVEDNPGDVRLAEEAFKLYGNGEFQLLHASSIQGALDEMVSHPVDAVLMDLFLPDVEGLEGVSRMAKAHPGVPVIAMSSFFDERFVSSALQMGARAFLPKTGLKWEDLVKTVRLQANGKTAGLAAN